MAPQQEKEKRNLQKKNAPGKHIHQGKRESLEKSPCIFHKHVCMHTHMQKRIHKNNFTRTHTHTHKHKCVYSQYTRSHWISYIWSSLFLVQVFCLLAIKPSDSVF